MERKPAPDHAALHEAALQHLSRYAATEAGLLRILERRVARWARQAEADVEEAGASYAAAREVTRALAGAGVVDDAAFAEARARRLQRAGRSRRAVVARLVAKGVEAGLATQVLDDAQGNELAAALAYARTRRIGPFRNRPDVEGTRMRELAALARAGFPRGVAEQALVMDRDAADALVIELKQG